MEKGSTVLPPDFDGTFRFTNPTDEEFVGRWNSKEYRFPPMSTSPMLIIDATPIEVQHIRKKFAKELAEREFFKSQKAKELTSIERTQNGPAFQSFKQANSYSVNDLEKTIQKCLEPLPISSAIVTETPKQPIEEKLHRDEEGELVTTAIDKKMSLKKKALEA